MRDSLPALNEVACRVNPGMQIDDGMSRVHDAILVHRVGRIFKSNVIAAESRRRARMIVQQFTRLILNESHER